MQTVDVIQLIDKNPNTRMSQEYENTLLMAIKDNFSDKQQQFFVANFYCNLNYDSKKDFVIDFDKAWKWLGFSRKDHGKRVLEKYFVNDVDYKITRKNAEASSNSGLNKEEIRLTVSTFHKFCLKSGTKKADEVHDYYLRLEELLQEIVNKETNELRKQLSCIKGKFIIERSLSEKHLKKGVCLYLIRNLDTKAKMIKVGIVQNLNELRVNFTAELLYVMFTENNDLDDVDVVKESLKVKYRFNINFDDWILNIDGDELIKLLEMQARLLNIVYTGYKNISEIEGKNDEDEEIECGVETREDETDDITKLG